jgi:hypothetical protein
MRLTALRIEAGIKAAKPEVKFSSRKAAGAEVSLTAAVIND